MIKKQIRFKQIFSILLLLTLCPSAITLLNFASTSKADDTNLAPTYTFELEHGSGPSIIHWDTSVVRPGSLAGGSIRIDQLTSGHDNPYRESDYRGWNIHVNGGEHVVYSCWIKTSCSSDTDVGGRIGIDCYGYLHAGSGNGAIKNYNFAFKYCAVPWGSDWTLATIEFDMPRDLYGTSCPWGANASPDGFLISDSSGNYIVHSTGPYVLEPWLDVRSISNPEPAWFSDTLFQVNPSGSESPTAVTVLGVA